MIRALNTQTFNCLVCVMKGVSGTSVSAGISNNFPNYYIDNRQGNVVNCAYLLTHCGLVIIYIYIIIDLCMSTLAELIAWCYQAANHYVTICNLTLIPSSMAMYISSRNYISPVSIYDDLFKYRDTHYKDKTVMLQSYLYLFMMRFHVLLT